MNEYVTAEAGVNCTRLCDHLRSDNTFYLLLSSLFPYFFHGSVAFYDCHCPTLSSLFTFLLLLSYYPCRLYKKKPPACLPKIKKRVERRPTGTTTIALAKQKISRPYLLETTTTSASLWIDFALPQEVPPLLVYFLQLRLSSSSSN